MDFLIKALQLILSLSILIILHEFGHYAFAKLFKTRVEKFYLFFDPWFSLFKFKKGETEYGIGWVPLGGYVKISGMIDESMDKEAMKEEPKPYEFRSKPAYQRLLIMIGGVLVNILLAFFIFWIMLFYWGESYVDVKNAKYGLSYHPIANEIGIQDGDVVTKVGSETVVVPSDILRGILLNESNSLTVKRGDSTFVVEVSKAYKQNLIGSKVKAFADYRYPFIIDSVLTGSNASKANLMKGDSLMAINGQTNAFFNIFQIKALENKNKALELMVKRGNDTLNLSCQITENGKIGIINRHYAKEFKIETKEYGFFEALPAGIGKGISTLTGYVTSLKYLFTKEGAQSVGGFGAMGSMFPTFWDWHTFWATTAFFSIALAFMNILPIPALDGGHVLFLLYEIITRRKPNEQFMEYAQYAGMILLLGILLFANGNDLFRLFSK